MGKRHDAHLIVAALISALGAAPAFAACSEDTVLIRGDFGSAQFTVDVADTAAERAKGLMFVEEMANTQGMLFVYGQPQRVSFWMRNTLIPLDMVFVGSDGVIDNIHFNAQPLDETPIFGGSEIQYVLEINGGLAARLGIEAGHALQHPAIGPAPVWPCEGN